MSGNISYTISRGVASSAPASLAGSYLQAGGTEQALDQVYAAGGSLQVLAASFSAPGNSTGDLVAIELYASTAMTVTTNGAGAADVQTVSISGTPTGGTFPLVFNGQVAAGIAYDATAATVQTALRALSSIGSAGVTCTGGPLPGTAVVCTFAGTLATGLQPLMLTGSGGLTGGTSPAVSVAHTTPGLPQDTISLSAGVPFAWDSQSGLACPFAGAVTEFLVTNTNAGRLQGRILTY